MHGCFNASIPKPNLVPMETWRDAGPRIGAELEFEVTALDADAVGVLLIRGRLDRTRSVVWLCGSLCVSVFFDYDDCVCLCVSQGAGTAGCW